MIHWGSDVPPTARFPHPVAGSSTSGSEEDIAVIRPSRKQHGFYSSNPRIAVSLNQLNLEPGEQHSSFEKEQRQGGSNTSSQSSLTAQLWTNRGYHYKGINKKLSSDLTSDKQRRKSMVERLRSKSLEDITGDKHVPRLDDLEVSLDIIAPPSINEGENLTAHMSITNHSFSRITVSATLRVDDGRRKIKTKTQQLSMEPMKTSELSLLISSAQLWPELMQTEKSFKIHATAHNHDSGRVFWKIVRTKIHWRANITRYINNIAQRFDNQK